MSERTLYDHVWEKHRVDTLSNGQDQLFIGLHLIHEVTTPQAFAKLREQGLPVAFPDRTVGTVDHIVPTKHVSRPYEDAQAELMVSTLEQNVRDFGIRFFDPSTHKQGIVHVVGPELGLTRPGMTIACGDSHTSTHGAFGSLAFGIGSTEVSYVLQTQTLALNRLKVRKIQMDGELGVGIYAKDVILRIIHELGVKGGLGYAYEYGGSTIQAMSMDERMTMCNMSIEGGARIGYVNPDQTTYDYIKGREFAPTGDDWDRQLAYWKSIVSASDAKYDDVLCLNAADMTPMVTWGITPGQSVGIQDSLPAIDSVDEQEQPLLKKAYDHMNFKPGMSLIGQPVDVVFIGSCTNSRLSDLREAARLLKGKQVSKQVQVFVVPGSQQVKKQAEDEGLDQVFIQAGVEWRHAGCSMCLGMNTDKLVGNQLCASTSNRNFIGRQGSPSGRTLLMSPAMAVMAAVEGRIVDVREYM
ncbi:MAG: 3-isopropylmalate dehydratase large subunit [bacterium]